MSRQAILSRISEALKTPRPHRAHGARAASDTEGDQHLSCGSHAPEGLQQWLPDPGDNAPDWLNCFKERCALLKTELIETSTASLSAALEQLRAEHGWTAPIAHSSDFLESIFSGCSWKPDFLSGSYNKDAVSLADVSFTTCESLVAQTGSILVSSGQNGGRTLSVLPPHHVVIATADQLVPDLASALRAAKQKYAPNFPSMLSFITGPSRTGDIERILVLGAHGPKKLTAVLVS